MDINGGPWPAHLAAGLARGFLSLAPAASNGGDDNPSSCAKIHRRLSIRERTRLSSARSHLALRGA